MDLDEAVRKFVKNGDVLTPGGTTQPVPSALVMEVVRQRKRNLTVVTAGAVDTVDMLVGAGCVKRLEIGFVAIHSPRGLSFAPCVSRALKEGIPRKIEIEDYTNLTMTLRFFAGACRLPFIPVNSMVMSDVAEKRVSEKKLAKIRSPFDDREVLVVPASNPDVAFLHCQIADKYGNAQRWGMLASDIWAAKASRKIIVSAEKIVESEEIRKNPNLTVLPGFMVDAVVEVPFGSHWWACQGFYLADKEFQAKYYKNAQTAESFESFLEEYVYGVESHEEYLEMVGRERLAELVVKKPAYSKPVNYGCE